MMKVFILLREGYKFYVILYAHQLNRYKKQGVKINELQKMIIIMRMSKLCLLMMMVGTIVNGISFASLACSSYCREDKNAGCTGRCISFYPRYSDNSEGNLIDEQCWDLSSCAGFPIIHHYVPVEKEICSSECGKWEGAQSDGWSYFPIVVCVESLPEDYSIPTNICEAYEFWSLFPAFLLILYFIL